MASPTFQVLTQHGGGSPTHAGGQWVGLCDCDAPSTQLIWGSPARAGVRCRLQPEWIVDDDVDFATRRLSLLPDNDDDDDDDDDDDADFIPSVAIRVRS